MTDAEFNSYVKRATLANIGAAINGEAPAVELCDGHILIIGDGVKRGCVDMAIPRHAQILAFQLSEAVAELQRREWVK